MFEFIYGDLLSMSLSDFQEKVSGSSLGELSSLRTKMFVDYSILSKAVEEKSTWLSDDKVRDMRGFMFLLKTKYQWLDAFIISKAKEREENIKGTI